MLSFRSTNCTNIGTYTHGLRKGRYVLYENEVLKRLRKRRLSKVECSLNFQAETGRTVKTAKMEEMVEMEERVQQDLEDLRDHKV